MVARLPNFLVPLQWLILMVLILTAVGLGMYIFFQYFYVTMAKNLDYLIKHVAPATLNAYKIEKRGGLPTRKGPDEDRGKRLRYWLWLLDLSKDQERRAEQSDQGSMRDTLLDA